MRILSRLKSALSEHLDALPLCLAAFLQSCAAGIWFVAMPFVIKRLGGTDTHLGLCMGSWFATYLLGCFSGTTLIDRIRAKPVVQFSAASGVGINIAVLGVLVLSESGRFAYPIPAIFLLMALSGVLTALFWPPLMGWVSHTYEGPKLNRRLGLFNLAWSSGAFVTSYFGGLLVEQNSTWPFIAIIIFLTLSLIVLSLARESADKAAVSNEAQFETPVQFPQPSELTFFRWASRIGMLIAFVCIGLARTQLAVLFKYGFELSESTYGFAMMLMSLLVCIAFLLAGRIHQWHYKFSVMMAAQIILIVTMVLTIVGRSIVLLCIIPGFIGAAEAFLYASHLYYGVSGKGKRAGRMAIHELTLASGFVLGSVVGGFLGDHFGMYAPYYFGLGVVAVGMIVQVGMWLALRRSAQYSAS